MTFADTADVLTDLLSTLSTPGPTASTARIVGRDPLAPSPHRLADTSAAAIAAFGLQVAGWEEDRGGAAQEVVVTAADALDQLRAVSLTTVNGVSPHALTDDPTLLGLNDFYPARDGWVFLLSTYPHLRAAVCRVLDCPPDGDAIAARTRHWSALELEEAVVAAGGVAAATRTPAEWSQHPVGSYLATRPVVEIEQIGEATPTRTPQPGRSAGEEAWVPLRGVRVIDNTHVIAGPVATQLLATFGASVLHTSRPDRPDPIGMLALTGGGKHNAYADLRDASTRSALDTVTADAHVFVNSYRNLDKWGFGAADLAARHPGIVVVQVHCWGPQGPWSSRGGFDQLACAATGFALEEGALQGLADGRPALPPTYLLNDYLAAYLSAAGTVAALRRQAVDGGSWRVTVNLARVCTWVREAGLYPASSVADLAMPSPSIGRYVASGPFGQLDQPRSPLSFSGHATPDPGVPTALGTAALQFWS